MTRLLAILVIAVSAFGQTPTQNSPMPQLPADVPSNATIRVFLSDKTPSGQDAVWTTADGAIHELFQFNDRGRGPQIYTEYRVGPDGILLSENSRGHDYMKKDVRESFSLANTVASWKNQTEDQSARRSNGKFYIGLNSGPEESAILARALLQHGNRLEVLPSGAASINAVKTISLDAPPSGPVGCGAAARAEPIKVTLYEITGLGFEPNYIWLDEQRNFFASTGGWSGIIRDGFESSVEQLSKAQQQVEDARGAMLAQKLTTNPTGEVVIRNVNVFDSETGKVLPNRRVTIRGERIASVETENNQAVPKNAIVRDGAGKTLLPGLWDMHQHLDALSAYMNLAAGVTSVRDMGNPIDQLTELRRRIDSGAALGPRVIAAGFIDGPGPFQGPIKVLADNLEEARHWVNKYADLGYVQIKIYSSVKPELVPLIAQEAHKRGLRVSGHVPSGMIASQFIEDGADEIQHMNFIFLNFMPDVKETRTPARFTEPGKRGASIDVNGPEVAQFIALLQQHHTVLDPTLAIWEDTYIDRAGKVPPGDAAIFNRLPVQAQRGELTGGEALPVPDAQTDQQYRASFANFERMLKRLYDSGVPIVAGTDEGSGWALHRELELYVHAGIPAPEVLRIATLKAAQLMKRDNDLGAIAPGKLADVILINGNPAENISDIRKTELVIKGGKLYNPADLYREIGVQPR